MSCFRSCACFQRDYPFYKYLANSHIPISVSQHTQLSSVFCLLNLYERICLDAVLMMRSSITIGKNYSADPLQLK